MKRQLSSSLLLVLGVFSAYAQAPAQGVMISRNTYFCDPATVNPCPAKTRQIVYTAPTGETLTHMQELTVPGNPEHIEIRGHGIMAAIYPEIGSYWSLESRRYTPAGLAAIPAGVKVSSTCDNGGALVGKSTMLGYTVYEYETRNERARILEWLAPDLQCQALRRGMYWTDIPDPTIDIADSVVVGNQPDSIWSLSAGLKEVDPNDLYRMLHISRYMKQGYSAAQAEAAIQNDPNTQQLQTAWVKQHGQ